MRGSFSGTGPGRRQLAANGHSWTREVCYNGSQIGINDSIINGYTAGSKRFLR